MAEQQKEQQSSGSGSGKEKVRVVVTIPGREKLEFYVEPGTEVSEVLEQIEEAIGESLEGFTIRLNDQTLETNDDGELENPTIETNSTLILFKKLVGGIAG